MSVRELQQRLAGTLGLDNDDADLQDAIHDGVWTFHKPAADTAGTDYTYFAMKVPFDVQIISVSICPHATLTANDTNYATITLEAGDGAAGSTDTVASQTTKITGGSGDWAADTYVELTVDPDYALVDDGQMLLVEAVKAASGVAVPIASFTIRYRRR